MFRVETYRCAENAVEFFPIGAQSVVDVVRYFVRPNLFPGDFLLLDADGKWVSGNRKWRDVKWPANRVVFAVYSAYNHASLAALMRVSDAATNHVDQVFRMFYDPPMTWKTWWGKTFFVDDKQEKGPAWLIVGMPKHDYKDRVIQREFLFETKTPEGCIIVKTEIDPLTQ